MTCFLQKSFVKAPSIFCNDRNAFIGPKSRKSLHPPTKQKRSQVKMRKSCTNAARNATSGKFALSSIVGKVRVSNVRPIMKRWIITSFWLVIWCLRKQVVQYLFLRGEFPSFVLREVGEEPVRTKQGWKTCAHRARHFPDAGSTNRISRWLTGSPVHSALLTRDCINSRCREERRHRWKIQGRTQNEKNLWDDPSDCRKKD